MKEIEVKDKKQVFKKKATKKQNKKNKQTKQTFRLTTKKKKNVELLNSISCDVHLP